MQSADALHKAPPLAHRIEIARAGRPVELQVDRDRRKARCRIQACAHRVAQAHVRQHGDHCHAEMAVTVQVVLRGRHLEDRIHALDLGEYDIEEIAAKMPSRAAVQGDGAPDLAHDRVLGEILWLHDVGSGVEVLMSEKQART